MALRILWYIQRYSIVFLFENFLLCLHNNSRAGERQRKPRERGILTKFSCSISKSARASLFQDMLVVLQYKAINLILAQNFNG